MVALGLARQYKLTVSTAPPLLEAMSCVFIAHLQDMEVAGLHKTYINISEPESILKGQIRFQESMHRLWSRGKRHIAFASYFELTANIPENQLLCYACHSLIRHFLALGFAPGTLKVLGEFKELFLRAGVTLRLPLKDEIQEAGLSPTHISAIRLANALIARQGVELPLGGTDIFLPSFLIDMETLFEEYVLRVLGRYLTECRVVGAEEAAKSLFDDETLPEAKPDVVIYSGETALAVGDVKYKPRYTREDLNQVITYALSYGVTDSVLFLPALAEREAGLTEIGKIRGIQVYQYALWLGSAELLQEAKRMANSISRCFSRHAA